MLRIITYNCYNFKSSIQDICDLCNSYDLIFLQEIRGGFLIRRSSAIRKFFAGFLTCDYRTIIKAFLKKSHCDFAENSQEYRTKTLRQIILIIK